MSTVPDRTSSKVDGSQGAKRETAREEEWVGKVLGRFKLTSFIGKGAMGRVFRAEDVTLKRQVALKIFPEKVTKGQRTYKLEQFIREARSAASLEHPHVVHVYEIGQAKGWYYIAMELLEGGSLMDLVEAGGPMDQFRACSLCADAAEGLHYAHKLGIIHRDVKPANLMLTRAGRCKITDFGLARLDDPSDPFSMPSEAVGTPLYVSPEVIGGTRATPPSDVYSLGATVWFLLVGKPPFLGKTQREVLLKHKKEPLPPLTEIRSDIPASLQTAIEKAMAKKPEERYESAEQFARVLRAHTIPVSASGTVPALSGSGGSFAGDSYGMASVGGSGQQSVTGSVATSAIGSPPNNTLLYGAIGLGSLILIGLIVTLIVMLGGSNDPQAASPAGASTTNDSGIRDTGGDTSIPPAPPPTPRPAITFDASLLTDFAVDPSTGLYVITEPGDRDLMMALTASPDNDYIVKGRVGRVDTGSAAVTRVFFEGVSGDRRRDFVVVYFDAVANEMEKLFGGTRGKELEGQLIAFRGPIDHYTDYGYDQPQIKINSMDQVLIVE